MTDTETPTEPSDPRDDAAPSAPEDNPGNGTRGALIGLGVLALILLGLGWSWFVVIIALVVMIFLHELGHYVTAKAAGMKVTEFFIGFGPRLWSFHRGETEYGFKAIPAGAYVKIIGMTNLDEIDPAEEDRTYRSKPYWRKLSVAVAGSAMHFIIALVLIFALLVGWGLRTDESAWEIESVVGGSAAAEIGFEPGDRVVEVDGQDISTFDDLRAFVTAHPDETATFVVDRDGELVTLAGTIGVADSGGGQLGVQYDPSSLPRDRVSPLPAVGQTFTEFGSLVKQTVMAIPEGVSNLFEQVVEGPGSDAPASEPASAPTGGTPAPAAEDSSDDGRVLSIYGAARIGTQLTEQGIAPLLGFMVLINVFVGIFNLVPLLPLDGGHVVVATYEKLRSRPGRPYRVDVAKLLPLTYAVLAVLVLVGVSALWLDIADPVNLPS